MSRPKTASSMARLTGLREEPLPLLDPHPTGRIGISSVRPPGDFERMIEAATARIDAGEMSKVVLAREVLVRGGAAHQPAAVFGALRGAVSLLLLLLLRHAGGGVPRRQPGAIGAPFGAPSVSTVALAGSTRRSSDPAVDDHLGGSCCEATRTVAEHAIVAERIVPRRATRTQSGSRPGAEPEIVKVANIQHLATPVIAQLAEPRSAVELAGLLHPTQAVGGEPWSAGAAAALGELEQMDRGWYAGPVGWMDSTEDGEFCVALRGALLRDREAHLYAGVGVVASSDPAAELAETEIKLGALLPLLARSQSGLVEKRCDSASFGGGRRGPCSTRPIAV